MIPYSRQNIDSNDLASVNEVMRSDFLTTGPTVEEFEDALCTFTSAQYAVAVSSCTAALHLSMLALGIGPGDLVYVSAISFVASANCVRYCGAEVEFCDVEGTTGNLDLKALEQQLEQARLQQRLPKAIVVVHLAGRSVEMIKLQQLKEKYHFYIVEDAAHATGSIYQHSKVGSCRYSDIAVYSFHPVKIITTAEGGMCFTNDAQLYETMRLLRGHGITKQHDMLKQQDKPAYYYEMQTLGFNYRISDLQCALGLSQLSKLKFFLEQRREMASYYNELFAQDSRIGLPQADSEDNISSWHLYQIRIPDGKRDVIFTALRRKGIGVQVHYIPIYQQPYYQKIKNYPTLKGSEEFFKATLSIPLFIGLGKINQQIIRNNLLEALDS